MRAMRRIALIIAIACATSACGLVPMLPPNAPADHLEPGDSPPLGGTSRIEGVALADDGATLVLEFTGGPPFKPDDSCSKAYVGWVALDATDPALLHALVIDVTPRPLIPDERGCDSLGHRRSVNVPLGAPFDGDRIVDDTTQNDATTWFLRAPGALAELPPLPDGWTLAREESLPESPGGRWMRTFVAPGVDPDAQGPDGRLVVIQGFGQAAGVTGGAEQLDVQVNGMPAVLSREPDNGELVLVWRLGPNGMGLVAGEPDFSVAELIRLAEGVRAP